MRTASKTCTSRILSSDAKDASGANGVFGALGDRSLSGRGWLDPRPRWQQLLLFLSGLFRLEVLQQDHAEAEQGRKEAAAQ
mmetsp:Transcript_67910/g.133567  ORF Transcript_67910/g.133567 Transcript_67910/m.133567 type:complete len:81 (-) Transcript_67910:1746-1988(-)